MKTIAFEMDRIDRDLLNLLQSGFPLVAEPFQELGARLGISGSACLERTQALQSARTLRAISGIFDPQQLGYVSTLAALHVGEGKVDQAANVVSAHPGVSHNYSRGHYFNLWFTIALPASEDSGATISELASRAAADAWINLPALRMFKLRVYFDMTGGGETPPQDGGVNYPKEGVRAPRPGQSRDLSHTEKLVVRQLCQDMPLAERPFDMLAQEAGLGREDFLAVAKGLEERGVMRRLSAVLRHRQAGFLANGMTCWEVPEGAIEEAGAAACSHKEVSHCYQRRTCAQWSYNLFAMVHGKRKEDCQAVAGAISREIGQDEYLQLFSDKEYKKEKVRYFADLQ